MAYQRYGNLVPKSIPYLNVCFDVYRLMFSRFCVFCEALKRIRIRRCLSFIFEKYNPVCQESKELIYLNFIFEDF